MPLSQKQMEYLALAWSCFESEPKIDYEKFREVAGLASAHSARELMRVTKKKLHEEYGSISKSTHTTASKANDSAASSVKANASRPKAAAKSNAKATSKETNKRAKTAKRPPTTTTASDELNDDAVSGAVNEDDDMLSPAPSSKRQRTESPGYIKTDPDAIDDLLGEDPGYLG